MNRWIFIGATAAAVALIVGGGSVAAIAIVGVVTDRQRVRDSLRSWAVLGNLEPDYLEAIGYVESKWNLEALNMSGADGARGGSWGPTQISERTARAVGYLGPMQAFREDPALVGQWTARILNEHRKRGELVTLADYVGAWNAGRDNADRNNNGELEELPATHSTRTTYLPRALAALEIIADERAA